MHHFTVMCKGQSGLRLIDRTAGVADVPLMRPGRCIRRMEDPPSVPWGGRGTTLYGAFYEQGMRLSEIEQDSIWQPNKNINKHIESLDPVNPLTISENLLLLSHESTDHAPCTNRFDVIPPPILLALHD